ncbi:GNAT family N-acetyltransferase [Leptolyngbya sp. FACHB-261]|uniref:GNAT family N-acetyltransferase n=1 Tax=Leptolyngbya sp. FACHB-261 TaxID=2692806 RepID=UPI0018F002DD|nr:GNAT family N-acetyltransferase [Leptolyngbya sp. FACHB-261]
MFETKRLLVREWLPKQDAEQAFEIYSDPEVMRFIGNGSTVESVEVQQANLQGLIEVYAKRKNGTGSWAIVTRSSSEIVGAVILKQLPDNQGQPTQDYEVGWHLKQSAWGKGYATEAGRAAIEYGFKLLKLPVIYAVVRPENTASRRVTERLGMVPMGRSRKYYGVELDLFKLDAENWAER